MLFRFVLYLRLHAPDTPRALYVGILIVGTIIFAGIPLVIYSFRRKSWAAPKAVAEFEPFSWEKKR